MGLRDGLDLRTLKVWCLLVLTAIFAHALAPVSVAEIHAAGSPFNPSTVEVSTGYDRREAIAPPALSRRDPGDSGDDVVPSEVAPAIGGQSLVPATLSFRASTLPTPASEPGLLSNPRAPPTV
ncbi:hypothetical protein WSK_0697 [Novosphingobium sp. Rr 2-17]|uniref:hypothetical protein n=1 Tax=Novosphingobium sp. Rr 2-17 TaxID=555793 RepID=UPI0002697B0C|nr:hypothetical protein [Novosphingobium sp. Rr 2-17]EIZ80724.1 hypothetical protein WSK_0697 [Novosphingobium sp. Rr 2-17]